MTERWLVLGATGQLGRSMLACAEAAGVDAVGHGRESVDIRDTDAVERALADAHPDVVLNAAAFTAVDRCETERAHAFEVNAWAPGRLARQLRGRALLVHVSTEYVFRGDGPVPIPEDGEPHPESAYGASKLAGEQAVSEAGGEHLIVRTQWLFGPGHNFVRTMQRLAEEGGPLRVVEDQLGRPTWTAALAEGILAAARTGLRGPLHLACEGIASWFDFACAIVEEGAARGLHRDVSVVPVATEEMRRPARRPAYGVLGLARARAAQIELPHWRHALASYLDQETAGRAPSAAKGRG